MASAVAATGGSSRRSTARWRPGRRPGWKNSKASLCSSGPVAGPPPRRPRSSDGWCDGVNTATPAHRECGPCSPLTVGRQAAAPLQLLEVTLTAVRCACSSAARSLGDTKGSSTDTDLAGGRVAVDPRHMTATRPQTRSPVTHFHLVNMKKVSISRWPVSGWQPRPAASNPTRSSCAHPAVPTSPAQPRGRLGGGAVGPQE